MGHRFMAVPHALYCLEKLWRVLSLCSSRIVLEVPEYRYGIRVCACALCVLSTKQPRTRAWWWCF